MKRFLIPVILLLSMPAFSNSFEDAELKLHATLDQNKARTSEEVEAEGVAVNSAFEAAKPCRQLGISEKTNVIIELSGVGEIINIWSNTESLRAVCTKGAIYNVKFPAPPYTPYFLRAVM